MYLSIDDSLRRLANQAFFDKLVITDADTINGEPGEPFSWLSDPEAQRTAVERKQALESGRQAPDVVGLEQRPSGVLALRARQQTSIASVKNTSVLSAWLNPLWA